MRWVLRVWAYGLGCRGLLEAACRSSGFVEASWGKRTLVGVLARIRTD